eukprot:CAMPEP_0113547422 /NCGR_PEP_ID=MMETSP0015_2-20120614/12347_1 /TAXON_ID=2838 /ORGANISM="Odontella" /LENGTH=837 /DNA_ID=CAMNT_0000447975 /DNA_START=22 /DNA_END=2535 /DNA_ORIENTATION=+ /assembly_acc=CAM_ASM_000160
MMSSRTRPGLLLLGARVPFLLGGLLLLGSVVDCADATSGVDLSNLPWDELRASLNDVTALIETGPEDYLEQCYPVFPLPDVDRSHYDLLDQPAGVCMNQLLCGFKGCNPFANYTDLTILEKWVKFLGDLGPNNFTIVKDVSNPSYNVPNYVLFPKVLADVHAAVAFAKEHGIELSVKNSGHSYTGASTKADTLHLNMNHYRRYASEENSKALVECIADEVTDNDDDTTLADQPCRVALARKKDAFLRVGGGENWDKVYRAVKEYNEAWNATNGGGYKHLIVGGAAGTVSPMGWTFQGGLSGTTNGRTHGFGVDQVLQLEMVLPLGHHVRFGPSEWTEAEGFRYPRTTKVTGVCNSEPSKDESEWVWGPCTEDIDFDGLWFAQNGGGGGSYGIVTSIYLQLHEYLPLKTFTFGSGALVPEAGGKCNLRWDEVFSAPLGDAVWSFVIDYFHNPSIFNVTEETSDLCAAPAFLRLSVGVCCYGDGADAMLSSWKVFLESKKEDLIEKGVNSTSIETAASCVDDAVLSWNDYAETVMDRSGGPHTGKSTSMPIPSYTSTTEYAANILLPREWMLENKEYLASQLNAVSYNDGVPVIEAPAIYLAFGGGGATAHDQANSLSAAHRGAGGMIFQGLHTLDEDFWAKTVPAMYPQVTGGSSFPAFVGSNHVGPNTRGPLKNDWTKPCSLDMTEEERDAKCVSLQEAIWGTETLARLEILKTAVDPHGMLSCHGCVQTKKMESTTTSTVPSTTTSTVPSTTTSTVPSTTTSTVPSTTTSTVPSTTISTVPSTTTTTETSTDATIDDPVKDSPDQNKSDPSSGANVAIPYTSIALLGVFSVLLSLP